MFDFLISIVVRVIPNKMARSMQEYDILEYFIGSVIGAFMFMFLIYLGEAIGYMAYITLNT